MSRESELTIGFALVIAMSRDLRRPGPRCHGLYRCGDREALRSTGLQWRGQGLASRAIDLIDRYLRMATDARGIVLRIAPTNAASVRVAEKAGFTFVGVFDEPEGRLARYLRNIRS